MRYHLFSILVMVLLPLNEGQVWGQTQNDPCHSRALSYLSFCDQLNKSALTDLRPEPQSPKNLPLTSGASSPQSGQTPSERNDPRNFPPGLMNQPLTPDPTRPGIIPGRR